jgi:hypothetical protein
MGDERLTGTSDTQKEAEGRLYTERLLAKQPPLIGDRVTALVVLPRVGACAESIVHREGVVEYVSKYGWMTIKTAGNVRFTALWR